MLFRFLSVLTLSCLAMAAMAVVPDTLKVNGHYGFFDSENKKLLVSVEDNEIAASLPGTVEYEGAEYGIESTTLPLVGLTHKDVFSDSFTEGKLMMILPEGRVENYSVEYRYRGVTALSYTKKSYAVKLLDETGSSLDASFLGMRSDNSWILDAMACDISRMRNRVSTDLWLDFSQRPYYADEKEPDMSNGTHGKFVEVFVNQRYWGLYCLTEKIDRKQLKVKKFKNDENLQRGVIYKSTEYDNMRTILCEPDNGQRVWQAWEAVYPDVRKNEPLDWGPLYNLYTFLGQDYKSQDIIDHFDKRVDVPLWVDYILYCDLMHATDNAAKNLILYYRDVTSDEQKVCICPWDLDATWGRSFNSSEIAYNDNCVIPNAVNAHLLSLDNGFPKMVFRWADLRRSYLKYDVIWPYFERYFTLFESSGAAARETARWQDVDGIHLDFAKERRYIRSWIDNRLHYLDLDYIYDGIEQTVLTPSQTIVYNLQGKPVGRSETAKGVQNLSLPPGIYLFGGQKIFVR